MLRALVLILALTAVAHADEGDRGPRETKQGRETIEATNAHYEAVAGHRNPLVRLWDLTGNAEWTNLQSSHRLFGDSAKEFEEAVSSNSEYQIHSKLGELKSGAEDLERKIAEYKTSSKGMTWKLGLALGLIVLAGGFAFMRRRRR